MRKSKFLTFCFALMPGAGQMYQGFLIRGTSIMLTFFAVIAFAVFVNMAELTIILPVIWFYSFFDCMNKSSYTVDELSMIEDKMILGLKLDDTEFYKKLVHQKNALLGWILMLLGVLILYNTIIRTFMWKLERYLPGISEAASKLPVLVLAIIIIMIGIRLIAGPKNNEAGEKNYEE